MLCPLLSPQLQGAEGRWQKRANGRGPHDQNMEVDKCKKHAVSIKHIENVERLRGSTSLLWFSLGFGRTKQLEVIRASRLLWRYCVVIPRERKHTPDPAEISRSSPCLCPFWVCWVQCLVANCVLHEKQVRLPEQKAQTGVCLSKAPPVSALAGGRLREPRDGGQPEGNLCAGLAPWFLMKCGRRYNSSIPQNCLRDL